ncbi:MAG: hypothetical protein N3B12_01145 [Armatimonadetes bacterium]|nr:hypothetical protein [Armatimonadota bacterium]
MDDPIAKVIDQIARDSLVRRAVKDLKPHFLNNVGEIFEIYGFATTRQHLKAQKERGGELDTQAGAILAALDYMEKCELIHRDRAIGRLLIKTLRQCCTSQQHTQGGHR